MTHLPSPHLLRLLLALGLCALLSLAHAQKKPSSTAALVPQEEPSTMILSDTLHFDDTKRESTFSGNVHNLANTVLLPNAPFNTGPVMLAGAGAPSLQLGNVGDVYTDTTNRYIYGPKQQVVSSTIGVTLSWGAPTIPVTCPKNFQGYGVPETDPSGSTPGDTYTDLSTGVVYKIY